MSAPLVRPVEGTSVGKECPICQQALARGEPAVSCPSCLAPQHAGCWEQHGSCGSYFCARETQRSAAELGPARIVITRDEAERAPTAFAAPLRRPAPAPLPTRVDPHAKVALIVGLLALPLVGCVTGPIAVLIGAASLGRISASGELTGSRRAAAGFVLGILATVGWTGGLAYLYHDGGGGPAAPFLSEGEAPQPASAEMLARLAPAVREAMRSNVLVQGSRGLSRWMGSGIVVAAQRSRVRILTNRHVAGASNGSLTIHTVDGRSADALVVWEAPDGIDLALLEATLPGAEGALSVARCAPDPAPPAVGQRVFAVGNPHALGWSYTEGVVSAQREHAQGARQVTYIQTQTPLNPGNSGGGLYDMQGYLIGVNTWKASSSGEGLNFAIAISSALTLRADLVATGVPDTTGGTGTTDTPGAPGAPDTTGTSGELGGGER